MPPPQERKVVLRLTHNLAEKAGRIVRDFSYAPGYAVQTVNGSDNFHRIPFALREQINDRKLSRRVRDMRQAELDKLKGKIAHADEVLIIKTTSFLPRGPQRRFAKQQPSSR